MGLISACRRFRIGMLLLLVYEGWWAMLMGCRSEFSDKFGPQMNAGFIVYYVSDGKGKVTAFKPVSFFYLTT
jgi:hypothetical protein